MTRALPEKPSLVQLKKQAKNVLKAHQAGDRSACETLAYHPLFKGKSPEAILKTEVDLQQAQHALAIEYGFENWSQMKEAVELRGGRRTIAADMAGKVRREGSRTWIAGLEKGHWGGESEQQDTLTGSLSAILLLLGHEEATFNYLVALSGSAFRVQIGEEDWDIGAPYSANGFDCSAVIAPAMGYRLKMLWVKEGDAGSKQEVFQAIARSIDDGCPVVYSAEEAGAIVGYDSAAGTHAVRNPGAGEDGYEWRELAWEWRAAGILTRTRTVSKAERARESLVRAVALAKTPTHRGFAGGFRAYEMWAERLEDDAKYAGIDEEKLRYYCHSNGHMSCSHATARNFVGKYLRGLAEDYPAEVGSHLLNAARKYEALWAVLATERKELPLPCYLFPWDFKQVTDWSNQMRQAQAAVLREVLALEKEAISEIAAALALME